MECQQPKEGRHVCAGARKLHMLMSVITEGARWCTYVLCRHSF